MAMPPPEQDCPSAGAGDAADIPAFGPVYRELAAAGIATASREDGIPSSRLTALTFDPGAYRSFLDGSELSDAQKDVFLESLWSIMVSFVDLGFHMHPLQHAVGQDRLEHESDTMLPLDTNSTTNKTMSAAHPGVRGAARSDS